MRGIWFGLMLAILLLPVASVAHAQRGPGSVRSLQQFAHGGLLVERSYHSPALRQEISYQAFIPPDYLDSTTRYPSLYLLHGLDANSEQWPVLGVPEAADEMIAAGEMQPLVIVFPFGSNSYYLNEGNGGLRWADHVAGDLIKDVDSTLRTIPRRRARAIGGLSMGGDAALRIALRRPLLFGVVGAHSPSTRRSFEDAPAGVFEDEAAFNRANPLWRIQLRGVPDDLAVWIDVGEGDPWWWSAEALHRALDEQGVAHDFHYFPGEHDEFYWAAHVRDYLRFYADALAGR